MTPPIIRAVDVDRWVADAKKLVGVYEIAERAGVKVNTVHVWRSRHDDFPEPVITLAMGPVWLWDQVSAWIDAPGRVHVRKAVSA